MITVDVKIDLFSKMVMEKGVSEDRRVLEMLNRKYAQILDDMETKCHEQRSVYLEDVKQRAIQDKNKLISKTESGIQKSVLVKKNELYNRLKKDLIEEIERFTLSKAYEAYFLRRFDKASASFVGEDDIVVGVKARDLAFVPAEMSSNIDDNIIGGFYLIRNGRIKYDYTINAEIENIEDYLGCEVNNLFEDNGERCHEGK